MTATLSDGSAALAAGNPTAYAHSLRMQYAGRDKKRMANIAAHLLTNAGFSFKEAKHCAYQATTADIPAQLQESQNCDLRKLFDSWATSPSDWRAAGVAVLKSYEWSTSEIGLVIGRHKGQVSRIYHAGISSLATSQHSTNPAGKTSDDFQNRHTGATWAA